ncbi:MAG: ABC transporter ATP-binding protein [Planctomycetes bacterium]|nr:ABC transporter ATP-binding protein [Planctomycetota bacterium]MCB9888728.1 ABC transporter ATP-binding protein [Planctomycetota bacterium]
MSRDELAIRAVNLGKCYHIYAHPTDRLKQFLFGRRRTYYREFWANRGIDLELYRGQTCGIVGANGAGKTTLLQMLAGTLQPTEGELECRGRITSLLELGSGFNAELTGRENVFLNGAVLGVPRSEMEARFEAIQRFADIGDFLDQPVKTYSSGMFVRLAFSVLANLEPDIFIVDEALAVGDAYFRHRCMHRFHELQERGTTILFVSHDAVSMKRLCDHVVWLEHGTLRQAGSPQTVVESYLKALFQQEVQAPTQPEPSTTGESETPLRFDQRSGDGSMELLGASLLDENGAVLSSTDHDRDVSLRLRIVDRGRPAGTPWLAGYILRNSKGEDLASSNSRIEGADLGALGQGEEALVSIHVRIPRLAEGSYSFSPSIAYDDGTKLVVADQLDNALVFEISARRDVYCILSLETSYARVRAEPIARGVSDASRG